MVQDCAVITLLKNKEEGRALARRRLRPYASAMLVDDTLHGGKPDACAGKLADIMKPLKRAEEMACVCHIEPDAIIANIKRRLAIDGLGPEFDARCRLGCRKLPGVGE